VVTVRSGSPPTRDRGTSDALGLVLVAPVAIGFALLVVLLSRQVDARAQVRTAAESAAQAAAQERSPAAAEVAARQVISAMLIDPDACDSPSAAVDLTGFAPGGLVSVTVSCSVSARGVEVLAPDNPGSPGNPGSPDSPGSPVRRFPGGEYTVTATATIDPFRAAEPAP
jgi:Flp pilus assembly protein TadG